jgi:hypothetical protein
MSISGELPGEGSDGEEEVFINEEDIIHEISDGARIFFLAGANSIHKIN